DATDQVRPRVTHGGVVDLGPAQPRLLDDVLGVGGRAEHLVGDGEQQAAVASERVVAHAEVADPAEGCASGTVHAFENHWASLPSAVLRLVVEFANPTTAVSSTRAGAPSFLSSRADSSSVTLGGVSLIASEYSMTSRSSGVNTVDSRHRGTSLAFASSSPSLWAWK